MKDRIKIAGPMVSLTEAASRLQLEYPTARLLAKSGVLLAHRTSQGWMVSLRQVEAIQPLTEPHAPHDASA